MRNLNLSLLTTFSDEIFRRKKPKLLAANRFVVVVEFSLAPKFSLGAQVHISIRLLVRNYNSSLLAGFRDKLGFVADNVLIFMFLLLATTYFHHFMLYSATK